MAKPLGFTLAQWPRDPQGIYFGGNDMLMTPRQMVAFGELFLNRGRVKELQLVPASWIASSFIPRGRSGISEQLYGYSWWIREIAGEQAYYAWGYGGQFIFLVPELELVVVTTSSATSARNGAAIGAPSTRSSSSSSSNPSAIKTDVAQVFRPAVAGLKSRATSCLP